MQGSVQAHEVTPRTSEALDYRLWQRVGELVDRARSPSDLRVHRLEALASWHWRQHGRPVPEDFAEQGRSASIASLLAPLLLARVRAACDGPIVVLKGPEVAARYPHPSMRPFVDLDLLVPDAAHVQRALVAAGFVLVGDEELYRDIHHLRPLHLEGFPLVVEVHAWPKWPVGIPRPDVDELLAAAVEPAVPIEGISGLPPAYSALLVAAHAWAHAPLARLRNLVDVAAVRQGVDEAEIDALSVRWGIHRVWRTTSAAVDALLDDGRRHWPLRSWARHLPRVREQTVFENHLGRWLAGFSTLPPARASSAGVAAVVRDISPVGDEGWGEKVFRSRRAMANARAPRSRHEEEVELELRRRRLPDGGDGGTP